MGKNEVGLKRAGISEKDLAIELEYYEKIQKGV